MSVVIKVKGLNEDEGGGEDEEDDKLIVYDKCFEFWCHEHPILMIWIFICILFLITIGIGEYSKNN
jgi:hypothetical protein